jgi:Rieske Fe-S protein
VQSNPIAPALTRRTVVVAGACGAACAAALSACSSDGAGPPAPAAPASPEAAPAAPGGSVLASTSDIPVGGGAVFPEQKVVVTQPAAGEFKAFSAICTHKGCTVGTVADGVINCPCHGSKFAIADGSVANGPAETPLEEKRIQVDGDSIVLV